MAISVRGFGGLSTDMKVFECVEFERFKLLPRPYQTPIHRPRVDYRYDPETQTVELVESTGGR